MNLDEAIEAGFADIDGRLLTLPDIDANGRAIVPYGVRTLGKGCIRFKSKLEYLLLPDSLEELEEEAIHCIVHVKGVATYSHNDDPMNMEVADGLCDLRSIKRFAAFPLMGGTYNRGEQLFDKIIISSVAEIGDTKLGCDGPISVVGDGAANISIDGVLYTDGGETLALFPPTHETVEKFVVPDTVKSIAPPRIHKRDYQHRCTFFQYRRSLPGGFQGISWSRKRNHTFGHFFSVQDHTIPHVEDARGRI